MNLNFFGREPALLLDAAKALLVLLVGFGVPLSNEQQTWIIALLVAIIGLWEGLATRPVSVIAITDVVQAALVLAVGFGLNWSGEQIALLVGFAGVLTTLIQRANVSPAPKVPDATAA